MGTRLMFGRKKEEEEDEAVLVAAEESEAAAAPPRAGLKPAVQGGKPVPYTAAKPEPRRAQEYPVQHRVAQNGNGNGNGATEAKRLIVGRDIVLNGAINSCDKLIVEGRVEASL